MPSTPIRSDADPPGAPGAGPRDPAPAISAATEAGDTERPPPSLELEFGPEPASGVAPAPPARPPEPPRSAPLRAAPPRPVAGPAAPGGPSSARLVAAPPSSSPSVPRVPAAPSSGRLAAAPAAPAPAPAAPAKAAAPRVATMLGAGLAPPVPAPAIHAASEPLRGPATVPAPPPGSEAAPSVVSIVTRDATSSSSLGVAPEVPLTRRCTACQELYPGDFLVCPRDATPLVDESGEADVDPLVGKLLGETYQIVRVVGEGGMGRVYEARHLRLKERRFAVKTLHGDLARNTEIVARFMREAESASSLSHPNVVDVFDVHHLPDGTPYFVAELLEGEELADYITKRGPLDPRMAATVVRQVCRGLAAAHARGIVHRDMKPENIFVLGSSIAALEAGEASSITVKVLDFGISKAGGAERTHLTRTGMIMGTPSYMAPEQARGKAVDHRADIYSVGAVLYYAITGKRPFDSDDPTSTISMVLTQDPVRPRTIDPRIPEALELVVQRAMAKDVGERYQSMRDLEKALASLEEQARGIAPASMMPSPVDAPALPAASGAERALDVARRMLGASMPPGPAQSASLARVARPTIVVTSAVLGLWLVGSTTAALAGLVRVLHDGEITLTECVLLVVGCLFAAATPIALYVLHLKKVIWPNSVRALQHASDLKRTTTAALVTYGGLSIIARVGHTVLFRSSKGLVSGFWDIALLFIAVAVAAAFGGLAPLVRNARRRRSS